MLLERRPEPACPRCGEVLLQIGDACAEDHAPLRGLAFARAPFRYAATGGALVRRFKLSGDFAAGRFLAVAMAGACRPLPPEWRRARMVSVPLHAQRRRQRGFDQAAWLAEELAARLGLQARPWALRRTRPTLPQGDPRVTSRSGNVEDAFAVARPRAVAGCKVILVDDVLTSGATARTCAAVLRRAGATEVALLTACRA
jgi:ComF family protein